MNDNFGVGAGVCGICIRALPFIPFLHCSSSCFSVLIVGLMLLLLVLLLILFLQERNKSSAWDSTNIRHMFTFLNRPTELPLPRGGPTDRTLDVSFLSPCCAIVQTLANACCVAFSEHRQRTAGKAAVKPATPQAKTHVTSHTSRQDVVTLQVPRDSI